MAFMKMQAFANNMLKNGSGSWNGMPRLFNQDKGTYSYGFSQANLDATSPFAATKVSKCWIEANSDIVPGSLITDLGDGTDWFVMTSRAQLTGGERVYWDATLYVISDHFWVKRFDIGPLGKDANGRDRDIVPKLLVTTMIPTMVNPQKYGVVEQPDSLQEENKIRVAVQKKYGITNNDRLEDVDGHCLIVKNVDRYSLGSKGLHILWVDEDTR